MSLSNYLEQKIRKHLFGIASYSAPSIYMALSTANPTDDGSAIAEPSGNAYARVSVSGWTDNSGSERVENSGTITFPTATGSWGTITHFALFDASSAGNMLWYGALSAAKTIGNGDAMTFAAGNVWFAFD